jgi:hypothetical protein
MTGTPILTIDVAHPPRSAAAVERDLLDAWNQVRNSPGLRILKIIHGHGSSGKGGSTRLVVRNWAFQNRERFRAVIEGEAYEVFDEQTAALRTTVGQVPDSDLGSGNPGITIVWIK